MMSDPLEQYKQAAALAALELVQDGMTLGLGTGSTARLLLAPLAERISREGLRLTCVPTSEQTAQLARDLSIAITTLEQQPGLDLTIDGADEILPHGLALIKGRGGALLREKIVALSSKRMVIIADDSKLVQWLGEHLPLPVEVIPFGWKRTAARIAGLGGSFTLRLADPDSNEPYRTDSGNFILDCHFGPISDPTQLHHDLKQITGVLDTGLFVGIARLAFVAGPNGVKKIVSDAHQS